MLEYNGMKLSQSVTVCRFLANEFGIAGKTNCEKGMADMIVDTIVDVQIGNFSILFINRRILATDYMAKINESTI